MCIVQNRLVIAVLLLGVLAVVAEASSTPPMPKAAAPATQPVATTPDASGLRGVQDMIFDFTHLGEAPPVAYFPDPATTEKDTVVIPFPATFWTGLSTLAGMAGIYIKRRIRL